MQTRHDDPDTRQRALISVVDDDESIRESLPDLLRMFGFVARSFASADDFLGSDALANTRCLILDVSMPGTSGPQLQSELMRRKLNIPIIFITGQADPGLREELLSGGAVACLFKPFTEHDLIIALDAALGAAPGPACG